MDPWLHEMTWPALPESVGQARRFAAARLQEVHLHAIVDDARLITSELASNAVRHARTAFTLTLSGAESSLLVSVRDWSLGRPVMPGPDRLTERGRGLVLVEALSATWGVTLLDSGGKAVWALLTTT